jgi:hypothetical protein
MGIGDSPFTVQGSNGHLEDGLVKANGQWLFSKRIIYSESPAEWITAPGNVCWQE